MVLTTIQGIPIHSGDILESRINSPEWEILFPIETERQARIAIYHALSYPDCRIVRDKQIIYGR